MRSIISLITAAALVLHFWLGCCVHHAHAGDVIHEHLHATTTCSHEHGHTLDGAGSPGDSHELPECQDGQCVLFAGVRTTLTQDLACSWIASVVLQAAAQVAPPTSSPLTQRGSPPPLPVRRHVLHQHFLI